MVWDVKQWAEKLPRKFGYILGVPDSGQLVGHLLSVYMNLPIRPDTPHDVPLIVDDSLLSGRTMAWWRRNYPNAYYAALYVNPGKENLVDYYYETLKPPRIFEWNMFKHGRLPKFAMDMDGILCRDPTKKEIANPKLYERFINHVEARILPSGEVGWIVTSRLGKYYSETADWLARHGVTYKKLIMRNSVNDSHIDYKSSIYNSLPAMLFVESSKKQAVGIAKKTGRPVICTETMELF